MLPAVCLYNLLVSIDSGLLLHLWTTMSNHFSMDNTVEIDVYEKAKLPADPEILSVGSDSINEKDLAHAEDVAIQVKQTLLFNWSISLYVSPHLRRFRLSHLKMTQPYRASHSALSSSESDWAHFHPWASTVIYYTLDLLTGLYINSGISHDIHIQTTECDCFSTFLSHYRLRSWECYG